MPSSVRVFQMHPGKAAGTLSAWYTPLGIWPGTAYVPGAKVVDSSCTFVVVVRADDVVTVALGCSGTVVGGEQPTATHEANAITADASGHRHFDTITLPSKCENSVAINRFTTGPGHRQNKQQPSPHTTESWPTETMISVERNQLAWSRGPGSADRSIRWPDNPDLIGRACPTASHGTVGRQALRRSLT